MSYRARVIDRNSARQTYLNVYDVIYKGMPVGDASPSLWQHVKHLYPGSKYAVLYKVSQRVVKFAGQPTLRSYLEKNHHSLFYPMVGGAVQQSGRKGAKGGRGGLYLEATAGGLIGVSETVLLPLDRMKVLNQTNKAAVKNQGLVKALWKRGIRKLYAGAATTALRNAVGSTLFFGGTAFTKEYILHLNSDKPAGFAQNLMASTVGGVVGVVATSPMDVVKTRIQGQNWEQSSSGWKIFRETCRKEGFSAFYKGITPKVMTSAPRLVFGYTMTQFFLKYLFTPS